MAGVTIFHRPCSYCLWTDTFAPPHLCWVQGEKRYPADDGWRVWQDNDEVALRRRVKEALERGEITNTR